MQATTNACDALNNSGNSDRAVSFTSMPLWGTVALDSRNNQFLFTGAATPTACPGASRTVTVMVFQGPCAGLRSHVMPAPAGEALPCSPQPDLSKTCNCPTPPASPAENSTFSSLFFEEVWQQHGRCFFQAPGRLASGLRRQGLPRPAAQKAAFALLWVTHLHRGQEPAPSILPGLSPRGWGRTAGTSLGDAVPLPMSGAYLWEHRPHHGQPCSVRRVTTLRSMSLEVGNTHLPVLVPVYSPIHCCSGMKGTFCSRGVFFWEPLRFTEQGLP